MSTLLSFRPPMGESVPTSSPGVIVPLGSDPGPYTTDPPTSGAHFATSLRAGFYSPEAAATLPHFPAGFLVANLEQGDVVLWYNCAGLSPSACQDLQNQIHLTMRIMGSQGLVAFPWPSLDSPIALTAWGRLMRLPAYDLKLAVGFIFANRGRGPRPTSGAAAGGP